MSAAMFQSFRVGDFGLHNLKIEKTHFLQVADGRKKAEIRKDDRGGFYRGDLLLLIEIEPDGSPTGRAVLRRVTHSFSGYDGMQAGYALLSLESCEAGGSK